MFVEFNVAEWLPYLPIVFGIGFGFQKSNSNSQQSSETGLTAGNRDVVAQPFFRATQYGNYGPGRLDYTLENRVTGPQPTLPGLSQFGLYQPQQSAWDQGFQQAVTQALNKFSGNAATRGFLNPENINAIAGSAAMNVAPQFANLAIPTAGTNITNATVVPEQIFQNRASTLRDFQALLAQLITGGSTSQGTAQSSSFGVGAQLAQGKGGGSTGYG